MLWHLIKAPLIVPLLTLFVNICLVMSIMLFIERVYMAIVKLFIKLLGRKPEKIYKWEAMKDDIELGSSAYPVVLVQVPMYNEKEVPSTILDHIASLHIFCVFEHLCSFYLFVINSLP